MSVWTRGLVSGVVCLVVLMAPALRALPASSDELGEEVVELVERGRERFVGHCGACHGATGQGDGAVAVYLTVKPPDLTGISARAGGEFPFDEVYDVVDGRQVAGHGTRAMPVWGAAFKGLDPEADKRTIKERIVEVVYYLKSIQQPLSMTHPKMGEAQD